MLQWRIVSEIYLSGVKQDLILQWSWEEFYHEDCAGCIYAPSQNSSLPTLYVIFKFFVVGKFAQFVVIRFAFNLFGELFYFYVWFFSVQVCLVTCWRSVPQWWEGIPVGHHYLFGTRMMVMVSIILCDREW